MRRSYDVFCGGQPLNRYFTFEVGVELQKYSSVRKIGGVRKFINEVRLKEFTVPVGLYPGEFGCKDGTLDRRCTESVS